MTDIIATVQYDNDITVAAPAVSPNVTVPQIGIQGLSGSDVNLESLQNVDSTDLIDGSVLVYRTNTNKWTTTILLDSQHMEGGEF